MKAKPSLARRASFSGQKQVLKCVLVMPMAGWSWLEPLSADPALRRRACPAVTMSGLHILPFEHLGGGFVELIRAADRLEASEQVFRS